MIKLIPVFFSIFLFGFGGVFFTPKTFTGYFDTDPATNIQNGTGNWDFSTSNFSYNTTNYTQTKFVSGSNAVFGKSGSINPAGTVTVSGTQNIASLLFDAVPNYIITSGNLTCIYPSCTITNNVDSTIASTIIGNAEWTKAGAAKLILTANNSYTGATTVGAGTFSLGNGSATGNIIPAANLITNNAALVYDTPSTISHSGMISGTGTFTKQGSGNLALTATNTYTGVTTVGAGVLSLGDGFVSGNIIPSTNLITNNATLTYDTPSIITHSGTISGTGSLRKDGAGTLTITNSNPYSGATTVSAGTLSLSMTANEQNRSSGYAISSGATLNLDVQSGNARISFNNPTITGAGTFLKTGLTLYMADNTGNKQANFNMGAGGLVDVQGGWLLSVSTIDTNLADLKIASGATVTINDDTVAGYPTAYFDELSGAGDIRQHGSGPPRTLSVGNDNGTATFTGVVADSPTGGVISFTKAGNGTQSLTGINTFTGTTTISDGILQIDGAGSLNSGSYAGEISIASGARLTYSSSTTQTLSGVINGTGSLLKDTSTPSTLTLSNTNSYSGGTTIRAGTLRLDNTSGAGTGRISIGDGTLSLYRSGGTTTYPNTITSTAGTAGFLNVDGSGSDATTGTNSTYATGALTVDGTLTIARTTGGNGHTAFNNTVAGAGTLKLANTNGGEAPSPTAVGRAQFNGTFDFTGDVQVLANGNFLTISAPSLESVDIASSGYWTLVGGRISETKILTGSGTITKNAANDLATLEVGGTSSSSSFSGVIGQTAFTALGTVALSKVGSGTLILSGANTYTGGTTVSAGGTLRLENTSGAGTGGITINNSTLSLYRSAEPTTYTNTITIPTGTTGFLNVDGRGSNVGTSLNQTYDTGAITVNGTLTIARPTGGTGHTYFNSDVTGTGILKIDNTNAGVAPSTSSLGRCALMGTFGFTGDVEVLAGGNFTAPNVSVNSIDIAAGGYWTLGSNPTTKMLTGSGTITHSNSPGATTILQVGGTSSSSTFNGVIGVNFLLGQGTVGLNKVGTGTLVLGGDNTYNGGTTITAGSITCNHVNALGTSGAITVNAGATLNKNGTNCGAGRITCNGLCPD